MQAATGDRSLAVPTRKSAGAGGDEAWRDALRAAMFAMERGLLRD